MEPVVFLLMNTKDEIINSKYGLLSTIAWGIDGKVEYALEGSVLIGGASMQWLRDKLKLISNASESEEVAKKNNLPKAGVYVVSVEEFSAAEKAGIKAGDVIIEADDFKTTKECKWIEEILIKSMKRNLKNIIIVSILFIMIFNK